MKNFNIGISNSIIVNKINQINENENIELKRIISEYIEIIKNSPILTLEFKRYNNIENKYIDNDVLANRYIDNNIKLFEIYTIDEILNERKKIVKFLNNNNILTEGKIKKIKLYESINNLIINSICDYSEIDVDLIHESLITVLNHLKRPKIVNETIKLKLNNDIVEIAVKLFNKKYNLLENDDKKLIKKLINYSYEDKINLFNDIKTNALNELKNHRSEILNERIDKAIKKINDMNNTTNNINDNIITLYELKKNLVITI